MLFLLQMVIIKTAYSFFKYCFGFCGGGCGFEEEAHTPLNLTSLSYLYDSLHSKVDGCNWDLHDMHLYLGLNSTLGALHYSPSEHFPLVKVVEECADG